METKCHERIKELRADRGVTQSELAAAIHVSCGIISLWESHHREPSLSSLLALSEYFGVSIDYIVGKSEI